MDFCFCAWLIIGRPADRRFHYRIHQLPESQRANLSGGDCSLIKWTIFWLELFIHSAMIIIFIIIITFMIIVIGRWWRLLQWMEWGAWKQRWRLKWSYKGIFSWNGVTKFFPFEMEPQRFFYSNGATKIEKLGEEKWPNKEQRKQQRFISSWFCTDQQLPWHWEVLALSSLPWTEVRFVPNNQRRHTCIFNTELDSLFSKECHILTCNSLIIKYILLHFQIEWSIKWNCSRISRKLDLTEQKRMLICSITPADGGPRYPYQTCDWK